MGFSYGISLPMPDNVLTVMLSSEPHTMNDFIVTLQLNDRDLEMIENKYKNCQTETQKIIALNEYLNCIKYEFMSDEELRQFQTFYVDIDVDDEEE